MSMELRSSQSLTQVSRGQPAAGQYSGTVAPTTSGAEPASAERHLVLPALAAGRRLDLVLAELLPEYSRARIQQWLDAGLVLVDDHPRRRRDKVNGGERVRLRPSLEPCVFNRPQALDLRILFEDEQLLVIDKPAGLVVHPAAGNPEGTLLNGLLHARPQLAGLPRCGIVHRLDKDTSGLLVVAKTLVAHHALVAQLQARTLAREYRALVQGEPLGGGQVEAPIGRHPTQRTRMAVTAAGRAAITEYRVLERYRGHALLAVHLRTGRTHQIRVHMAHLRYPLVGDPVYGARPRPPRGAAPALVAALQHFGRQALHATRLGLSHPLSGETRQFVSPLADDLAALCELLARDREHA